MKTKAIDEIGEGMVYGTLLSVVLWSLAIIVVVICSGCAGIRIGADITRIDEAQESHAMSSSKLPWKCLFTPCYGAEK